jgi:hypothetical protein
VESRGGLRLADGGGGECERGTGGGLLSQAGWLLQGFFNNKDQDLA